MRTSKGAPLRRLAAAAVVATALLGATADHARGQTDGTFVGIVVGGGENTQEWQPPEETEPVSGLIVGAFADAGTPVSWLRVRAEGAYTQRGGDVELQSGGETVRGGVRTDYLTVGLHLQVARRLGPVRLHVAGGPTLDQVLTSTLDPILSQVLEEESATVFAVSIGTGLGAWITDGVFVGADLRLTQGLSDAYAGNFTHFQNRTVEARISVGIPVERITGG